MTSTPALELVTFQQFAQLSFKLAAMIEPDHEAEPFDFLISINRGGAVLSRILSDYLAIQVSAFGLASYVGINSQKELKIIQELNVDIQDKKVLLVDEICDSGKTFESAVKIAEKLQPRKLATAALFLKPHSTFIPTYHAVASQKWVVFPYEVRETLVGLDKFIQADPQTFTQLSAYFQSLGIAQSEITHLAERIKHV